MLTECKENKDLIRAS